MSKFGVWDEGQLYAQRLRWFRVMEAVNSCQSQKTVAESKAGYELPRYVDLKEKEE